MHIFISIYICVSRFWGLKAWGFGSGVRTPSLLRSADGHPPPLSPQAVRDFTERNSPSGKPFTPRQISRMGTGAKAIFQDLEKALAVILALQGENEALRGVVTSLGGVPPAGVVPAEARNLLSELSATTAPATSAPATTTPATTAPVCKPSPACPPTQNPNPKP